MKTILVNLIGLSGILYSSTSFAQTRAHFEGLCPANRTIVIGYTYDAAFGYPVIPNLATHHVANHAQRYQFLLAGNVIIDGEAPGCREEHYWDGTAWQPLPAQGGCPYNDLMGNYHNGAILDYGAFINMSQGGGMGGGRDYVTQARYNQAITHITALVHTPAIVCGELVNDQPFAPFYTGFPTARQIHFTHPAYHAGAWRDDGFVAIKTIAGDNNSWELISGM